MANATQTIAGDIQLAGDLAGNNNAAAPALTNTAVTPGTYTNVGCTIDSKGRITSAVNGSQFILAGDVTGQAGSNTLSATGVVANTYIAATISVDNAGRITSASSTQLGGDLTGNFTTNTLSPTGVAPATYKSATITVDAKGRITAASNSLFGGDIAGTTSDNLTLNNSGVTAGTYSYPTITVDTKGRITSASTSSISLGGDLTGSPQDARLANTGVQAGTYSLPTIVVNAKGLVTSVVSGTISLGGDLTGTINNAVLNNTSVTSGTYYIPGANFTVNSQGRLTSITAINSIPIASYTTKGIVQIQGGSGLSISGGGLLSATAATNTSSGAVKSGNTNNIVITSGTIDVGPNVARLDTTNVLGKGLSHTPATLTSGATITVDASRSNVFNLTLNTNAVLSNPINLLGAGRFTFIIKQDGTGGWPLTFGTAYLFASGTSSIQTTANAVNIVTCISDGTKMYCTLAKNFA